MTITPSEMAALSDFDVIWLRGLARKHLAGEAIRPEDTARRLCEIAQRLEDMIRDTHRRCYPVR
jgi:hypothetical protein